MKLTNYYEHEGHQSYMVYEFYVEERADHFEALLKDRLVEYERHLDTESNPNKTLFGVHKRYIKESNKSNFLTHAHFRSPLLPNFWLRWAVLIFTLSLITLSIIGWLRS